MVFIQQDEAEVADVSIELLSKARDLADQLKVSVTGALIGSGIKGEAEKLIQYGVDEVFIIEDKRLADYTPMPYTKIMIDIIKKDTSLKDRLWKNVTRFRDGLAGSGLDMMGSDAHIIPIHTKDKASTVRLGELLLEKGIFAPGIRPPTVPKNKCRIRVSLMATHTDEHIDKALDILKGSKDEGLFYNSD